MEPLPLRDIHLPEPIAWWPPAIGWWVVLAFSLLITAGLVYFLRSRQRVTPAKWALQSLAELEADNAMPVQEKLQALSMLMKRVALTLHPRAAVAGLTGEEWLRWVDDVAGDARFSEGPGRWLTQAPYRPEPDPAVLAELLGLCRGWLRALAKVNRGPVSRPVQREAGPARGTRQRSRVS